MAVLVLLEENRGALHRISLEALAGAQILAAEIHQPLRVLALGPKARDLAEVAATKAVDEVIVAEHELLNHYSTEGFTAALTQILEKETPEYFIVGHTYQVRDYLPVVSARLKQPFLNDVLEYRVEGDKPIFIRQVFNAKLFAEIQVNTHPPYLVSFQSAAFQADQVKPGSAPIRELTLDLEAGVIRSQSEEPQLETVSEADLSTAELIVSVGRGIGRQENLAMVEALTKAMGAELGSSRPLVDAGWIPPYRQVGSSGQTVAPKLYLALGISGSIQHVVGMKGSQHIVAINKDPEAPIFELADYGVVGDILEIVPKLTEAIQNS